MRLVAVVATLGRDKPLAALLESLSAQSRPVDQIVIVDQNADDRVQHVLSDFKDLPIKHIHDPTLRGVNRSRNHGWKNAEGDVFFFPDDDCWYPPETCERALGLLTSKNADVVSGRAAAPDGRTINGRFSMQAGWVDRTSAWFTQIEWIFFISGEALEKTGGFDEEIGPGSGTRWGANEVQDLSLAAISQGYRQYYEPSLIAHHEEIKLDVVASSDFKRLGQYARGFGYVLGKQNYGYLTLLTWVSRPLVGAVLSLVKANITRARLQVLVSFQRWLGYFEGRQQLSVRK
ncbi:MAG: glycosyltransferase family 2 protein [Roseobacter sp.]